MIRYYRLEEDGAEPWAHAVAKNLRANRKLAALAAFVLQTDGIDAETERATDEDREDLLEKAAESFSRAHGVEWCDRDELALRLSAILED